MRAAVLARYGKFEWKEMPLPEFGPEEALIRVRYAGICGTDQHIFRGEMDGRTRVPMIPGHEFAGVISETGKKVKGFQKGDRVAVDPIFWCGTCAACRLEHFPACSALKLVGVDVDGGFAEYAVARDFMLFKVPDSVSDRHAALIEILSIGFHACRRAELKENDTIAIWGAGRVGQSILRACRTITKGKVFVVDVLQNRLDKALQAYPDVVSVNASKNNPIDVIRESTSGRGVDVAFEAVGHAATITGQVPPVRACIQSIRGAGTVCVLGLADDPVPLVMKELIYKEARIVASRVTHGEFQAAISHLAKGELFPELLISAEVPAAQAQQAFEILDREPENHLKVLLKL